MRRPSIPEAVEHFVASLTDKYRRECIRYWREHYGDDFTETVRLEARKRLGKRRDAAVAAKVPIP